MQWLCRLCRLSSCTQLRLLMKLKLQRNCEIHGFHRHLEQDIWECQLKVLSESLQVTAEFCGTFPVTLIGPNCVLVWWLFANCILIKSEKKTFFRNWMKHRNSRDEKYFSAWCFNFHSAFCVYQKPVDGFLILCLTKYPSHLDNSHSVFDWCFFHYKKLLQSFLRLNTHVLRRNFCSIAFPKPLPLLQMFERNHPCGIVFWLVKQFGTCLLLYLTHFCETETAHARE